MTREPATDRRVQKTQRLLREALVALMHEKSYDSIAVKEILDRANVGRSAFYAHFHDKDALLASGIQRILQEGSQRRLPQRAERFRSVVWFSLPVFEYVDAFRHVTGSLMRRHDRTIVHEHLRQVLIDTIADAIKATGQYHDAVPSNLLAEYVVTTFILVLNWWVEGNSKLPPREADDLFLSMVLPTLAASRSGT